MTESDDLQNFNSYKLAITGRGEFLPNWVQVRNNGGPAKGSNSGLFGVHTYRRPTVFIKHHCAAVTTKASLMC